MDITLLADRGLGDQKLFTYLEAIGWSFAIRFRQIINVTCDGITTNRIALGAAGAVKLYVRRFTIEETFRDLEDNHFGMGLSATHIGVPEQRDRLLLIGAVGACAAHASGRGRRSAAPPVSWTFLEAGELQLAVGSRRAVALVHVVATMAR